MIFLGLFLTFVLGLGLVACLSKRLNIAEILGLAFPLGIFAQTLLMVCIDCIGIKLTASSVLVSSLLVLAVLAFVLFKQRKSLGEGLKCCLKFDFPPLNWAWFTGLAFLIAIVVMNVSKTLYFPTFDIDSVRSFNIVGKAIAHEGTIHNLSLFTLEYYQDIMQRAGNALTYIPLTQLSYTYVYLLGMETSKMINALMFISFVLAFYGVTRRFASPFLSIIITIFCVLTPEMLAFSSLSGTNCIHALYASLGIIYLIAWWKNKKDSSLLWLSAALLMGNVWTRNEGLAFIGAACLLLLYHAIKTKEYKRFFIYVVLCLFPFLFWHLFLKINHFESTNVIIFKPFYDGAKLSVIFNEMWILFKSTQFYGITFLLFLIVLISNVWNIFKRKDCLVCLFLLISSWLFYTILIYQVDYLWDSLENVMRYSYKRFLFSFVPLIWFYIACNQNVTWLFTSIDRFVFHEKKIKSRSN